MEDNHNQDHTQAFNVIRPGVEVNHFKIVSQIGVGGMGEVYLAEDSKLHRSIALKFLSARFMANEEFRERFFREARSAAALNHPNIITIFEIGQFQGQIYIAMEYVEGVELKDLMTAGELTVENCYDIAIQICDGLSAAHEAGLVHRDIKPLNILVDKNKRVRILDFGLAKAEGDLELTQAGTAMGTVNYMSPEQAQGDEVDNRGDLFSFGILFYELITGGLPFKTGSMPATVYSIVHEPYKPLDPSLDGGLKHIFDKALAKKPEERYQNILEMKNDIINLRYGARIDPMFSATSRDQTTVIKVAQPEVKALAVLYLNNLGSEDDEYLSYGITEDLIVDISRIGSIRVAPMRSVMRFKDSFDELESIAEKLKVGYILDGSIHKTKDSIRVSVQLVEIATGSNLWAERWQESLDNLPQIKKGLADGIISNLSLEKSQAERAEIGHPLAKDADAYENYLKGKYYFDNKKDKNDIDLARSLYLKAIDEEPSLIIARTGLAEINIYNGNLTNAKVDLEEALIEAKEKNHQADTLAVLRLLSQLYQKKSDWANAEQCANEALEITKEMGDFAGEADILGILISILQPQGKYDNIFIYFERILEISRQLDDQDKIAEALKNMGITYSRKGDYDNAMMLYDEAFDIAKKLNNLSLQAAVLSNTGNVYYFRGDFDNAYKHYQRAYEISNKLGDLAISSRQHLNMALIKLMQGNFEEGLAMLEQTAESFTKLGDRSNIAITLGNIAQVRLTLGEIDLSIEKATEALTLAREINHVIAETDALIRIGAAKMYSKQFPEAIEKFTEALAIAEKISNPRSQASIHLILARTYFRMNELSDCRSDAREAYNLAREIGDKAIMLQATSFLGALEVIDGMFATGIKKIENALEKVKSLHNHEINIQMSTLLGYLLIKFGKSEVDRQQGMTILQEACSLAIEKKLKIEEISISNLITFFESKAEG